MRRASAWSKIPSTGLAHDPSSRGPGTISHGHNIRGWTLLGPLWLIDHKQIFMSKLRRIMPTREYYLQQAKVLFELASKMSLKVDAERLIVRANEYQILASAFPADDPQGDDLPV